MLAALEINGGVVEHDSAAGRARLSVPATTAGRYTNAQLDDYHVMRSARPRRRPFASAAPTHLSLRARASHKEPIGTLGFGYWNEPFSIAGGVLAGPSAGWFFYASPPSDMALAPGVPGRGWKAATLSTGRWPGLLLAPAALGAIVLTRLPGLGRPIMRLARRFVRAHETLLPDVPLDEWHTYRLDWRDSEARFSVDGVERLRAPAPLRRRQGFVMWIDNQYAIVSDDGHFGFGVRPLAEPQWLEVEDLQLGV